jgi:shikimate kinase
VLAVGGGALLDISTRQLLDASDSPVVLLTATLPELRRRIGDGARRPLLAGDVSGRLAALAAEREVLLRAIATVTVATDGLTRQEVAERVVAALPVAPRT